MIGHGVSRAGGQKDDFLLQSTPEGEAALERPHGARDDVQYRIVDPVIVDAPRVWEFRGGDGRRAAERYNLDPATLLRRQPPGGQPRDDAALRMRDVNHPSLPPDPRQGVPQVLHQRIDLGGDPPHLIRGRLRHVLDESEVIALGRHAGGVVAVIDGTVAEGSGDDVGRVGHVFGEVGYAVYPC